MKLTLLQTEKYSRARVDIEAEKRLIEEVVQGLVEADIIKDLDRVMMFFAEDIIYHVSGLPLYSVRMRFVSISMGPSTS